MRTPEVPIEGLDGVENLDASEVKNPLNLRLAEAIEKRIVESEGRFALVFNRKNTSHVILESNNSKLTVEWRTHAKGLVFTGKIAMLRDGSVLGVSAEALHPSRNPSVKDVLYDFDGGIDPTQPYRIEGSRKGPEYDKYEVPLNTVVQIVESGHIIPATS